jgi:hypothetical protein
MHVQLAMRPKSLEKDAFSAAFLPTVLAPYKSYCQHLQSGEYRSGDIDDAGAVCSLAVEFDVSPGWYIESTGHFNAVDAIICFNQAGYLCVANLLEKEDVYVQDRPSLLDYQQRMLPDMLIAKLDIEFKKAIVPPKVSGRFTINTVRKFKAQFIADASCRFSDGFGGEARIDAMIAFKC